MPQKNSTSDPLVVLTAELAAVLQRWIDEHRADHPIEGYAAQRGRKHPSSFGDDTWYGDYAEDNRAEGIPHQGAVELLAAGLDRDTGVVRRILYKRTQYTSLELCDAILALIERPDATHNGEIHVVPNPYWNQERWIDWYLAERRGC